MERSPSYVCVFATEVLLLELASRPAVDEPQTSTEACVNTWSREPVTLCISISKLESLVSRRRAGVLSEIRLLQEEPPQ